MAVVLDHGHSGARGEAEGEHPAAQIVPSINLGDAPRFPGGQCTQWDDGVLEMGDGFIGPILLRRGNGRNSR